MSYIVYWVPLGQCYHSPILTQLEVVLFVSHVVFQLAVENPWGFMVWTSLWSQHKVLRGTLGKLMAAGWGLDIRSVFKSYQKEWLSSFGQVSWCHCQWLQITSLIFVYSWPFVNLSFLLLPSLNLTAAYDSCNCFLNLTPSLFLNILLGSGSFMCLTWTSDVIPSSKKVNKDFSMTYLFSGSWHGVRIRRHFWNRVNCRRSLTHEDIQHRFVSWEGPAL